MDSISEYLREGGALSMASSSAIVFSIEYGWDPCSFQPSGTSILQGNWINQHWRQSYQVQFGLIHSKGYRGDLGISGKLCIQRASTLLWLHLLWKVCRAICLTCFYPPPDWSSTDVLCLHHEVLWGSHPHPSSAYQGPPILKACASYTVKLCWEDLAVYCPVQLCTAG